MSESPRWIAFDAVGTLIFADPPVHLAYYRVAKRHGSQLKPEEVRARFRTAFGSRSSGSPRDVDSLGNAVTSEKLASGEATCTESSERAFWRDVVAEVLLDAGDREACFEELFAHFARPDAWQPYADVEETLAEAQRRGIGLALASNFDSRLHQVCDGIAELSPIKVRVISSEVGNRKPDAAFYRALMRACDCGADDLLMIGDERENDVDAPRRLGIRSLHLDRSAAEPGEHLQSLTDLWSVLDA